MLVGAKLEQFRPVVLLQDKASRTGAADLHQFVYGSSPETFFHGSRFAYPVGKERRTSWRASLLILETQKEDFAEGEFPYPGNKEAGFPGGPVC